MPNPTNNEILNFLGNSGKTTKEIAENFKIPFVNSLEIMNDMHSKQKVEYVLTHACKQSKWCKIK